MNHPHVQHPAELLAETTTHSSAVASWNDRVLSWIADNVLASIAMFDAALILPLLALPAPDSAKITLGVVSGSWLQWWALPALQRQALKGEKQRAAKADVDHVALTHIATVVDQIYVLASGGTASPAHRKE